jgi:predicted secreted protein
LAREQEIMQALAKVSDVPSLCQQIYPDIDDRLLQLAESTIEAHLLRLLELRKVSKQEASYVLL